MPKSHTARFAGDVRKPDINWYDYVMKILASLVEQEDSNVSIPEGRKTCVLKSDEAGILNEFNSNDAVKSAVQ